MNNLIREVIKRPTTILLAVITVVVFGIFSLSSIQMEYFPNMDMPMHVVMVMYPGADADSIESLVTEKIEDVGETLSGIKNIESTTYENYAMIQFTYEYGTDLDDLYMELKAGLDNLAGDLPDGCETPMIMEISLDSEATITVGAKATDDGEIADILDYVNDTVVPKLENINGVAQVDVSGANEEYTRITVDEKKMQQYGISISDLANVISSADFDLPVGKVRSGKQQVGASVHTDIVWYTDLMDLAVPTKSGALIRISDVVSDINLYREEADSISRFNGEDSVLIDVTKKSTGETMAVCKGVQAALEDLTRDGLEFQVVNSAADDIKDTLMEVLKTLIEGVVLSMIVLYLFFGDIRASLIVGSSMPLSLLAGIVLLNMMGCSFELMSGTGMIIAIGMLVDNSIVVLESCFRMKDKEADFKTAAAAGTTAVMLSVAASTLTTIVVYAPLAMTSGMSGQMNQSLCYTVIFTMISSLISAVTVVPTLFHVFRPVEKKELPINRILEVIGKGYQRVIPSLLRHPGRTIAVALALFVFSILLATQLNFDLFPPSFDGSIEVEAVFRSGTNIEVMDEAIQKVEQTLLADDNFDSVELSISGSAVNITAYSRKGSKRESAEAVEYYADVFADYTDMDIFVTAKNISSGLGALMSSDGVTILLESDEKDNLEDAVSLVEDAVKEVPGVIYIRNDFAQNETNARFVVDQRKAMNAGISPSSAASQIYVLLNGVTANTIEQGNKEYDVKLMYPEDKYNDTTVLMDQLLTASDGTKVPLNSIAQVQYSNIQQSISRRNGKFTTEVLVTTKNEGKYEISADVTAAGKSVELPKGVSFGSSSIDETMMEEMGSMGGAIVIAIYLVFFVMAVQFNSARYSVMIMMCLPFSLIGCFGLLFLGSAPLSMMAMMGFLMLIGMVVNNGILLVDTVNSLRSDMSMMDALQQVGMLRMRPILMTTLTTVLSMLPLVLSNDSGVAMMRGMGFVIIGGLCTSTVLALFMMPPFYLAMSSKKERMKAWEKP